jgi:hypothetical protein
MPKFVTIECETWGKPLGRCKVVIGRAKVLYVDSEVLLVRQFGSESLYHSKSGCGNLFSHNPSHPASKQIPKNHTRSRLTAKSVNAIRAALGLGPARPRSRRHI